MAHRRYFFTLVCLFFIEWVALAIRPFDRSDWALENVAMSTSMLFELFEWMAADLFGGDLGMTYLGTQGDVWDAHKDMALASLGALITMTTLALSNSFLQRDFALEWSESLRVKNPQPLGEDAIDQLITDGLNLRTHI
jgi:uncharacterized membrane protein YjdF